MPLNLNKLEKPIELANGIIRARCPACAESGQDTKGEHLRIYPDGKFGCCVFPQDREHRRRIFALAGETKPRGISVKISPRAEVASGQKDILGRLERVFSTSTAVQNAPDAPDGCLQLQSEVQGEFDLPRTPRTGISESNEPLADNCRTPRTPFSYLRACENEIEKICIEVQESEEPVRAVRAIRMPYLTNSGDLVIPFSSPERFHWWNGGQSVKETRLRPSA